MTKSGGITQRTGRPAAPEPDPREGEEHEADGCSDVASSLGRGAGMRDEKPAGERRSQSLWQQLEILGSGFRRSW